MKNIIGLLLTVIAFISVYIGAGHLIDWMVSCLQSHDARVIARILLWVFLFTIITLIAGAFSGVVSVLFTMITKDKRH